MVRDSLSETSNTEPPKKVDSRTDAQKADDKVKKTQEFYETALVERSKTSGKQPEVVFAGRVADGVETSWKNGKIPTVNSFKEDCSAIVGPSKKISSSTALSLAIKASMLGHVFDLADKQKASIKKKTPEIKDEELKAQVNSFIVGIYEVGKARKEQYEKDAKAKAEKAKADKAAKASGESQPQSA